MSTTYNPMAVMMGSPGKTGTPYIGGKPPMPGPMPVLGGSGGSVGIKPVQHTNGGSPMPGPPQSGRMGNDIASPFSASGPSGVLGPQSVRASGTGPFDPAFRQDLATFAGGLFNRPGGNLSFNPTSNQPFGQATGGGNAPLLGMPNTLLQQALGGNPFTYTPPPAQSTNQPNMQTLQDWLNRFMNQGRNQRPGGLNFNSA
jgi:hypothetical protein